MQPILLYITTKDKPQARMLAKTLLAERLIACANILPEMTSIYEWEGEIQQAEEVVLIAKTTPAAKDAAIARIVTLHSYDCPCVVALDCADSHAAFSKWIFSQLGD